MSTFGGFLPEFPHIRIDFFRQIQGVPLPLACFLSHVHSDHLAGLEYLKSPFIYCSAATKALLLRLERPLNRINFEKGILESRKQHFKHLKNLLKPIPLHTPTQIELAPGNSIQVTLFDANHCTGAVMFMIEGNGLAVLYTGDIRAEPWFVNALARNPCLIVYTSRLKTLDCIYLDTSFTEDIAFPTKAEGLAELLHNVSRYPPTTEFHFAAWTFGYEEVWIALSRFLKSQIHVDSYKMRLYESLLGDMERLCGSCLAPEAPILAGYKVGNTGYPGILTLDHTVRLHSCEKKIKCDHLGDQTVWIKPIIARTFSGQDLCEIGVGGGGGNLNQRPEIELDSDAVLMQLMELFVRQGDSPILSNIRQMLLSSLHSSRKTLVLNDAGPDSKQENLSLEGLANTLATSAAQQATAEDVNPIHNGPFQLPKVITFPYSRHSSLPELRHLVGVFEPIDVYPCTVDKANWHEGVSMMALFGDFCSGSKFRHDQEMRETLRDPYKDETLKSWNEPERVFSQTSSEGSDYFGVVLEDDFERATHRKGINLATSPIASDATLLRHMNHGFSGKHGSSTSVDATLPKVIIGSENSHLVPIMSFRPSHEPEQQSLRRKANLEGDDENGRKRTRLQGVPSSMIPLLYSHDSETPERGGDSQLPIACVPGVSHNDTHDGVYRCESCGWETWQPADTCTGCGAREPAYHEAISSTDEEGSNKEAKLKPRSKIQHLYPRMFLFSNAPEDGGTMDAKGKERTDVIGNKLDGPSAYDSVSDIIGDEYEVDGLIKDSPITTRNHSSTESSMNGDIDNQSFHGGLVSTYGNLGRENKGLPGRHEAFRRDGLDSDRNRYEGPGNPEFNIVNMKVQDLPISEVVLYVQGDSQPSGVSDSRLKTRVDAFLAAPEGWHNISLMSTGDNHTEESQEL